MTLQLILIYAIIGLVLATLASKQQIVNGNKGWGWGPAVMIVLFWPLMVILVPFMTKGNR